MSYLPKLAILSAVVSAAVLVVAFAVDSGRNPTVAQPSAVDAAASCGTGNPLHGRTQGVVDAIVEYLKARDRLVSLDDCSDVTTALLAGINLELDVSGRGLTRLRANDFAGLTNSVFLRLNLNDNDIVTIPTNAFSGMTNVGTIFLNSNQITTIQADAFNGLTRLSRIELSNNNIATIGANAFRGLSPTRQLALELNGNQITSLAPTISAVCDCVR